MSSEIIGRARECERLERCIRSESSQLIVVYGRRRVGKTFLINEYFRNRFAFKLTGVYGQDRKTQLRNFTAELNRKSTANYSLPADWTEAFEYLREFTENLPDNQKQIIFLDELPWLDTRKSGFLPALEFFWNDYASAKRNIILILCGSATSWMDEKIARNKGGLFNRQTCRLYLEPFKLHETEKFLESKGIYWSRYEIAECYMIMGGIPYYLNLIDPDKSLRENIDSLFFRKRGELWDEFEHLYNTLFTNSRQYVLIAEALSEKCGGLTRNEIIEKTGIPAGGDLSKTLNNLILSGFVTESGFYGKQSREKRYQLSDYYSVFYFRYIKSKAGKDEHLWTNSIDNPSRRAWAGLTFERLCRDHVNQIKSKLGISGVLSEEYTWSGKPGDNGEPGAQIDLIIDRRDHVVSLCEIKFSVNEYTIDKDYDMKLRNKIAAFSDAVNCRKTIQLVMITTYGVKRNKYSSLIGSQIKLDDLFGE